ncbi:MAG: protein kinase [Sedimentisphaerales bacterium]|nr:protein kinase [Sedimentisphaerales bacterium]
MNAEQIFHKAVEISDPQERAAFLDRVCGDNAKLRAEVEALLRADAKAGDFLESPPVGSDVTLDASPRIEGPGTRIGRYELLELIGEGGMGLVYLAEQKEPVKRRVALKIIKPGMDSKQVIARFEAERQALAVLDHPNIARVFDAGTTQTGRPYFVMEYVKGMPVTAHCDRHKLDVEQRLKLFRQVCEGVHHAHQKGIIHRDIKPSNILVAVQDDKAVPKIIDFGIAKAATQPLTDKTFFTSAGQLLGTPQYMSPEQVDLATHDIDTRSDIYSLGVVLYELLAGVLPFEAERFERAGLSQIQHTIREVEPASPSIRLTALGGEDAKAIAASRGTQVIPLTRRLHHELEWIPLKAMRKERVRRYRSASELADDIQNYLNGNPLIAGPETAAYRVKKFVRRHAGSVATVALTAAAIILGLLMSSAMYIRAEQARENESIARKQAEQAKNAEQEQRTIAEQQRELAEQKTEDLRRSMYANNIQLADAKYKEGNIRRVRELLDSCPNDLRGWEWNRMNYISNQSIMILRGHNSKVYSIAASPDGKRAVSASADGTIKIWDIVNGIELMTISRADGEEVTCVALSPDSKQIVSGGEDNTVKLWNSQTGAELRTFRGHHDWIRSVAFSPDGQRIVSGSDDNTIKLWDSQTGTELRTFRGHRDWVRSVAFSPDGQRIVSGSDDNTIKLWDSQTGTEVRTLSGHRDWVISVAFSACGRRIVSVSGDKTIKLWDAETGALLITIHSHDGPVWSCTFSPDGKTIASGGADSTVRIWDAETGEELKAFRGHEQAVQSLSFSPDGERIVSGSMDGTVRIWDVMIDRESAEIYGHTDLVWSIAFSPDGRQIVSASADSTIKLWDAQTGEAIRTMLTHGKSLTPVAFSPDGSRIASGERWQKTVRVWDALTGAEVMSLSGHKGPVKCVAFSPDGKYIASGSEDKTIKLWDSMSGDEVATLQASGQSVSFSPDGRKIICGSLDGTIKIWDSAAGIEQMVLCGHTGTITSITFSPDSRLIASASTDGTANTWDAATGTKLMTLKGHGNPIVWSMAFSPDGTRIVTAGRDETVRLWHATTGAELLTLRANSDIHDVVFSPDGQTIVAATAGGSIVFWESTVPTGGYEERRNAEIARRLVEKLYKTSGSYHDVIIQLKNDVSLDLAICKAAIQLANSFKWEDAGKLNDESWDVVSSFVRDPNAYREALNKAEKAIELDPNDLNILNTLGVAQYRVGDYEKALEILTRCEKLCEDDQLEPRPENAAFIAMSLHQLGRDEEAKAALERLRDLCKKERFAEDPEAQAFLAEAEKLIEGDK